MIVHIERPNLDKITNKIEGKNFIKILTDPEIEKRIIKLNEESYKPWKKFKFITPFKGLNIEESWIINRFYRDFKSQKIPIRNEKGEFFKFLELAKYRKFYKTFDSLVSGNLGDSFNQPFFLNEGILEESIESSRIEGAVVKTISDAKEMLRSNKKPRNKDEQMIVNNYKTIKNIQSEWKDQEMSLSLLLEIHFSLTQKTLEESQYNRLRRNSDNIKVGDDLGKIFHICPDESFLKKEIKELIKFANDEEDEIPGLFLHPLVKAVILHFWIGYLHPFVDGNGRCARGIFYWYLLKNGYWGIPFLPISSKIKGSHGQYRDAFLFTEQDENDFTYFFEYNIKQIEFSIKDFKERVQKLKKLKKIQTSLLKSDLSLNDRQIKLLHYFWQNPKSYTSFNLHKNFHNISLLTSRKDLEELEGSEFIFRKNPKGKKIFFFPNEEDITKIFVS